MADGLATGRRARDAHRALDPFRVEMQVADAGLFGQGRQVGLDGRPARRACHGLQALEDGGDTLPAAYTHGN